MRILVTDPISPRGIEILRSEHEVHASKLSPPELLEAIGEFDALVVRSETKVTAEVLRRGKKLRVVGRAGVGVDNIDVEEARKIGIAVVNAPWAPTNAVAELVLGRMIDLARHLSRADASMKRGEWAKRDLQGIELSGRTLALLGVGRIGSRVAELARAFGMSVRYFDPYVPQEKGPGLKCETPKEAVEGADFVSLHVPLTPETRHLVDSRLLESFKPGSFLLNTSRGGVVDERALLSAIESGRLGGAALDVFEEEPLPPNSPLRRFPQILLTPHLGASTQEAQEKAGIDVAHDVLRVLRGERALFRVV